MTSRTRFGSFHKFSPGIGLLLILLAGVHVLYGKTVSAGFVTDFTGLRSRLDGAPFWGFLTSFGFPAMHQVTNIFLYLLNRFFGIEGLPWYLVFTSLHVANGFTGYQVGKKIFAKAGFREPGVVAWMGCLMFFFSPYQAEAVVWKVCFNFLFSSFMVLLSLFQLVSYLESGRRRHLLLMHGFLLVGLFTFELALAAPLLAGLLVVWWVGPGSSLRHHINFIVVPQLLMVAGYFLINKIVLGAWVGHYGESVHLNFQLGKMTANALKYFFKYLLFWREWPHESKQALIALLEKPAVVYGSWALGAMLLFVAVFFFKKRQSKGRMAGLYGGMFLAAILPVSNLYMMWLLQGENDRYGYLASVFFFMGLACLLASLPGAWRWVVFASWLAASVFFLQRMTIYWQNNARVYNSLLEDFRWEDARELYVLALPENYQGLQMFRDYSQNAQALRDALRYIAGKKTPDTVHQVAQFNMTSEHDGVSVMVQDSANMEVTFNQWGNWWWRNGVGVLEYGTDAYQFKAVGNGYHLTLKKPAAQAVFIYPVGGTWYEVKF